MPPCKNGHVIKDAAYSSRRKDGYLCKVCRDVEEKEIEEESKQDRRVIRDLSKPHRAQTF